MFDSDAVEHFRRWYSGTVVELLGLELIGHEGDTLTARMTVGTLALNSQGFLHGGISPLAAETLASFASLYPRRDTNRVAGVSVFSNHLEPARRDEHLAFIVRPLRDSGKLLVWVVEMRNSEGVLLSVSQVTVAVKDLAPGLVP